MQDKTELRCWQRLPMPMPKDFDPGVEEPDFFYKNFIKHFIPDMIKMMDTGLNIDQEAVEALRVTVEEVLADVTERLKVNPLIQQFQAKRLPYAQKAHAEKCTAAVREVKYYMKEFNSKDVMHRTWVINTYLKRLHKPEDCKDKWTLQDLKKYNIFLKDRFLSALIDKRRLTTNSDVLAGMVAFAEYKLELFNRPRYEKAAEPVILPAFNPGSPKQLKEFFEMVGVAPLAFSATTGEASWGRDQLELVVQTVTEENLLGVLNALIDFSSSSIIQTNFLKAFDKFTVDGVLHGNIKLFGAKSCRNTSNSPNLLNAPSTGSIYAKPLKKCFIAPDGYVIYAIDYAALEDRVLANLTGDPNKIGIFTQGLDGHSLSSVFYQPEEAAKIVGAFTNESEASIRLKKMVDEEDPAAAAFRQASKAPTFKLAYGGYPDVDKGGVITQEIFDAYHNKLYPLITEYRENYVLATAHQLGYLHLGLGCRIYASDAHQSIRTLHNATCQFWSILTLIAINELNYQSALQGLSDDILPHATIYDSIYLYVKEDAETIKWLNDTLVPIMNVDYIEGATVPNMCVGEIGRSWASLSKLKNDASLEDINTLLKEL